MSSVNLHAVALLALPPITGVVCLVIRRRSPSRHQAAVAALIAGGTAFLVLSLSTHACQAGKPVSQCVIIGACVWMVLAYVKSRWVKTCITVVMVGLMILLSMQYVNLVHDKKWVGNVSSLAVVDVVMQSRLAKPRDDVRQVGIREESVYSEGWFRSLPIGADFQDVIGDDPPYRVEIHRVWHTWFTRLHRVTEVGQDFWYPGGRPSDRATNIVLEDAP